MPAAATEATARVHRSEVPAPFLALEAALRADADLLADAADAVARGDAGRVQAFVDRTAVFVDALYCHNLIVDELVVPEVVTRRPDARAVVARIELQHTELETLALRVRDRAGVLDPAVKGWQIVALALADDFAALRDAVHEHLDAEHDEFEPLWCAAFAVYDQAALPAAIRDLTAEGLPSLAAWVAHVIDGDAAATLLDDAPAALREAFDTQWRPTFARRPAATL